MQKYHMCIHIMTYKTALNSYDNLPCYSPDHQCTTKV